MNPLNVVSVQIGGANPGDFVIQSDQCSDQVLAAHDSCSLLVAFVPTTNGVRTASLTVAYESFSGLQSQTLTLSGTGDPPQPTICVAANLVAFPITEIGSSTNLSVAVVNCGTLGLANFNASISGSGTNDFSIVSPICPSIAPGAVCPLTIAFAPTASGTRAAALTLTGVGATNQVVQLTGAGIAPSPRVCIPGNLNFGSVLLGSNAVQTVVVTNCGSALLSIGALTLSGPDAAKFTIQPATDGCSSSAIPPGGNCSFSVTYAATKVGGSAAFLTINDNTATGPEQISLTAACVNTQPDASISSKLTAKSFVGTGIINATGSGQEIKQTVKRGKTCVFYVQCQNVGSGNDRFTVLGGGSGAGYAAQYFLGTAVRGEDDVNITRAVTQGAFALTTLGAGATTSESSLIRVVITADRLAVLNTQHSVLITFTSSSNPLKSDTVKATFTIK